MRSIPSPFSHDFFKGGPGSGNFGHRGRPGQHGGSAKDGNAPTQVKERLVGDPKSWSRDEKKAFLEEAFRTGGRKKFADGGMAVLNTDVDYGGFYASYRAPGGAPEWSLFKTKEQAIEWILNKHEQPEQPKAPTPPPAQANPNVASPKNVPQTYPQANNLDEAHDYAKNVLGISRFRATNLNAANVTLSALTDAHNKGYKIPNTIEPMRGGARRAVAQVETYGNEEKLVIANKSKYFSSPEEVMGPNSRGWWVAKTPQDLITHELGHFNHSVSDPAGYRRLNVVGSRLGVVEKMVAKKVSEYASYNAFEFIAETFAGHNQGIKYSSDVYDLYKRYGGPELR